MAADTSTSDAARHVGAAADRAGGPGGPGGPVPAGAPVDLALAAGPDAPARARHAAERLLAHWPPTRRDAILLVVSELVTNAVRHGSRDARDVVRLRAARRGATVRVEVTDRAAHGGAIDLAHATDRRGADARSGWGLPIVAELSDRWGVERAAGGTRVWCELDGV